MSEVGWIDTHNHLQVDIFDEDVEALWERAKSLGVTDAVITAGCAADWDRVVSRAQKLQIHYTLGIHPLYVDRSRDEDLDLLWERLNRALNDPLFVGIGEIGLEENPQTRDEAFFARQLDFAAKLALPVSVHVRKTASRVLKYLRRRRHVRKTASRVLKYLRRRRGVTGVIHAFNGSDVEREAFLSLGFRLGFGGAATYEGSRRIRRHLAEVPDWAWVLETDAPDMPSSARRDRGELRTEPADLAEYGRLAATFRGISLEEAARQSTDNARAAFPRLTGP